MINPEKSMVVAYLDLLGFSKWTEKDLSGACQLVQSYHQVVRDRLHDAQNDSVEKHSDGRVRQLVKQNAIDSFDYFLPFSDCIFLASSTPDRFIQQLSSFLIDSYLLTAQAHIRKDRDANPTLVNVKKFNVHDLHWLGDEKLHWFPVVFRGGISYGDIGRVLVTSITSHKASQSTQITGMPVVEAVGLEKNSGKGPRIFTKPGFAELFNSESQSVFRRIHGKDLYELLWPAFNFQKTSDPLREIATNFYPLFEPAASLWHYYNHQSEVGSHYFELMRLVIRSTFQIFGNDKSIRAEIEHALNEWDLGHKKTELMD